MWEMGVRSFVLFHPPHIPIFIWNRCSFKFSLIELACVSLNRIVEFIMVYIYAASKLQFLWKKHENITIL